MTLIWVCNSSLHWISNIPLPRKTSSLEKIGGDSMCFWLFKRYKSHHDVLILNIIHLLPIASRVKYKLLTWQATACITYNYLSLYLFSYNIFHLVVVSLAMVLVTLLQAAFCSRIFKLMLLCQECYFLKVVSDYFLLL